MPCVRYCSAIKNHGIAPSGRSQILFEEPGRAYVYLNYGMYWLFNVVTEKHGVAGAVLIRAVEPVLGIETMRKLRPKITKDHQLTNGPGKLTLAMGIGKEWNGFDLCTSDSLFIAAREKNPRASEIVTTTRIGISKGSELPWRFYLKDNPFVSVKI